MTTAQWYRELVEKNITMEEDRDSQMRFVKTRSELASPTTDWELTWKRARLKGLGSEATSFLWKLLHQLLPTEERLSRILPNTSADCKYCPDVPRADVEHCFFHCVRLGRLVPGCFLSSSNTIRLQVDKEFSSLNLKQLMLSKCL